MGGQAGFMCKVWTWIEAIQVETLTQNYFSSRHQRAQHPARKCARCESTTETYINVHDHFDSWSRCLWCISLAKSLQEFAAVLQNLEDERTRMVSSKLKGNTNSVLTGLLFPFIHLQTESRRQSWNFHEQKMIVCLCVCVSRLKMPMMCWLCLWSGLGKSRSVQPR